MTYALTYLPDVVAGPLLGGLADRYPRRGVMVAADLLRGVGVAVMAIPGLPLAVLVLLLPDATAAEAVGVADRIRRRINGLVLPVTSRYRAATIRQLTASIGVAVYPQHGTTLDQLLQAADAAMYRAKQAGRDRVVLAHPAEPTTEPLRPITA